MTDHTLPTPEMKAGTPDLFLVDTMTAIQMGPRNLKKYMYEIQEEGKKLGLVVKVEKTNSGLILWWYPQEMAEEIVKEVEEFDLNEVAEFSDNSHAYLGDDGELRNTGPKKDVGPWEWDLDNNRPASTFSFFDDVLQHMSAVPEGQMEAEKKLLLESVDVETLDELWGFFETAAEVLKLEIQMYSGAGKMVQLNWKPKEE